MKWSAKSSTVIAQSVSVAVPVIDLSGLEREQAEAEGLRLLGEDARSPFELTVP